MKPKYNLEGMEVAKLTSKSIVTAALALHTLLLLTSFSCYCSDFECNLNIYPNSGPPGVDFEISGFSRLDRDSYIGTYFFDIYLQDEQGQLFTDSYGYKNLGYAKFTQDYGNLVEGNGTIPEGVNPGKYKLIIAPPSSDYEYLVTYYLGCSEFTVTSIVDQDTRVDPSSGPGGTEFTISMYAKHDRQYYETLTNIDGVHLFHGDFSIIILNAPRKTDGEKVNWPLTGSATFVDDRRIEGRAKIPSGIAAGTYTAVVSISILSDFYTDAGSFEITVTSDSSPGWIYVAGAAVLGAGGAAVLVGRKLLGRGGKKPSRDYASESYSKADREEENIEYTRRHEEMKDELEGKEMWENFKREASARRRKNRGYRDFYDRMIKGCKDRERRAFLERYKDKVIDPIRLTVDEEKFNYVYRCFVNQLSRDIGVAYAEAIAPGQGEGWDAGTFGLATWGATDQSIHEFRQMFADNLFLRIALGFVTQGASEYGIAPIALLDRTSQAAKQGKTLSQAFKSATVDLLIEEGIGRAIRIGLKGFWRGGKAWLADDFSLGGTLQGGKKLLVEEIQDFLRVPRWIAARFGPKHKPQIYDVSPDGTATPRYPRRPNPTKYKNAGGVAVDREVVNFLDDCYGGRFPRKVLSKLTPQDTKTIWNWMDDPVYKKAVTIQMQHAKQVDDLLVRLDPKTFTGKHLHLIEDMLDSARGGKLNPHFAKAASSGKTRYRPSSGKAFNPSKHLDEYEWYWVKQHGAGGRYCRPHHRKLFGDPAATHIDYANQVDDIWNTRTNYNKRIAEGYGPKDRLFKGSKYTNADLKKPYSRIARAAKKELYEHLSANDRLFSNDPNARDMLEIVYKTDVGQTKSARGLWQKFQKVNLNERWIQAKRVPAIRGETLPVPHKG